MRYKSLDPKITIKNIEKILNILEIDLEIIEKNNNNYTFSHHIKGFFKGEYIGKSNGKGKSRELSLASGLAEFMERLSNDILEGNVSHCVDEKTKEKTFSNLGFKIHLNEKELSINDCYKETIFKELFKTYGNAMFLGFQEYGKLTEKKIPCFPFKNIITNEVSYAPFYTINYLTSSNGMVAGNSFEEAMIEGISELFERYAVRTVTTTDVLCPNINLTVLDEYPDLKDIINYLQDNNMSVQLKDFSCGGKFPAIALIVTDLTTGKYYVNVAANPIFHIAVERCFTEIFQNKNIDSLRELSINNIALNTNIDDFSMYYSGLFADGITIWPEKIRFKQEYTTDLKHFIFDKEENYSIEKIFNQIIYILKKNNINCWVKDSSYYGFNCYKIVFSNCFTATNFYDKNVVDKMVNGEINSKPLKDLIRAIIDKKNYKEIYEYAQILEQKGISKNSYFEQYLLKDIKTYDENFFFIILFFIYFFNNEYEKCRNILNEINLNFYINEQINNIFIISVIEVQNNISRQEKIKKLEVITDLDLQFIIDILNKKENIKKIVFDIDNYANNKEILLQDFIYHLHVKEKSINDKLFNS